MAGQKQARKPTAQSRPAAATKSRDTAKGRDKGTRGGRPDPQQAGTAARRQGGGQGRAGNGQGRAQDRRPPGSQWAKRPAPVTDADLTEDSTRVPLWLQLTTLVLSLGGLGVSIYLTIAHFTSTSILACSDKGFINCAAVTTSPEAEVFGIFPVAVLGLAFYVFLVAINTPWAWRAKSPVIGWARIGSLVAGIGFVLYLLYTELFTLRELCLWCTVVHVITFLLFALTVYAVAAGYGLGQRRAAP